jgi:hypothetical protein
MLSAKRTAFAKQRLNEIAYACTPVGFVSYPSPPKRLMHIGVERIARFGYEYGNPLPEVLPWHSISKPS